DQRQVVGGAVQLVVVADLPVTLRVFNHALGTPHVAGGDGLAHSVERDAVLLQLLRLQLHAHRRQRTAADLHLADTGNLRQLLREDGRGNVVELALVEAFRGQRKHHDRRLCRVDLAVGRHAAHSAGQQVARGVDRRLYLAGGTVDVAVQVELDGDARRTL